MDDGNDVGADARRLILSDRATPAWARIRPADVLSAIAVLALTAIAMSRFLIHARADSLLYSLVSTQRLTFFYWGQDRLANVVPALAWPVRDELANFYVQMAIVGTSFFALTWMFVRFHTSNWARRTPATIEALVVVASGFVTMYFLTGWANFRFVFEQHYAFAVALTLLGMRSMMGHRRLGRVVGAVLVLAATLVIPSSVLFAPFAWLLGPGNDGHVRRFATTVGVTLIAFLTSSAASRAFYDAPSQSSVYSDFSLRRAVDGLPTTLENLGTAVTTLWVLAIIALALLVLVLRRKQLTPRLRIAYVATPLFGLAWLFLFSANLWVELNLFMPRYFFPTVAACVFVTTGAMLELAAMGYDFVEGRAPGRLVQPIRFAFVAGLVALLGVGVVALQSSDRLPAVEAARPAVAAAKAWDAEFVIGDYWQVWPIVFVGRNEDLELLGTAFRSDPTKAEALEVVQRHQGTDTPNIRLVCIGIDSIACVDDFSNYVSSPWIVYGVDNLEPLVITVSPATTG